MIGLLVFLCSLVGILSFAYLFFYLWAYQMCLFVPINRSFILVGCENVEVCCCDLIEFVLVFWAFLSLFKCISCLLSFWFTVALYAYWWAYFILLIALCLCSWVYIDLNWILLSLFEYNTAVFQVSSNFVASAY